LVPAFFPTGSPFRHDTGASGVSENERVCYDRPIFFDPLPVSRTDRMALRAEAQKIAAEFEYSSLQINEGVKHFIRQMGGLRSASKSLIMRANMSRPGTREEWHRVEPDPYIRDGSAQWDGKGGYIRIREMCPRLTSYRACILLST